MTLQLFSMLKCPLKELVSLKQEVKSISEVFTSCIHIDIQKQKLAKLDLSPIMWCLG